MRSKLNNNRSSRTTVIFAAILPLVSVINMAEAFAKKKEAGKVAVISIDPGVHAGKAFDDAVKGLGKIDIGTRAALDEVKGYVMAVVTGKEVAIKREDEGELGGKKEIDPLTGEFVEEEPERGRMQEYSFDLGDAKSAAKFAATLRKGVGSEIAVTTEGGNITVRSNVKVAQKIGFSEGE